MLSMKEAIENYVEGCVGKVDCPAYKLFMKAILAGMIAKLNPLYVKDAMEQYGYTAQQLSTLNIPNFIFNNLIPVTIGNIVGGMAFFGIPLMYINGVGGKKA